MRMYIFILLLVFPACSIAEWGKVDTQREATWQIIRLIDYGQTLDIAKNPARYREINPMLGERPSVDRVHVYMITSAMLHYYIARNLKPKYRRVFQYISIGLSSTAVAHNASVGLRINF